MAFRPFQDVQISLTSLQDEMNKLFDRVWHAGVSAGPFDGQEWGPPIDLFEEDDRFRMLVELPGVEATHVDVTLMNGVLTVRGEKMRPADPAGRSRQVRAERRYGAFRRSIDLPGGVDPDKLSAKYSAGVLEVIIPKSEAARPKAVKIQVEDPPSGP